VPSPQLSIVIPAYNESARIENALARVMHCVETQGWDAEVLVVDDGSKDATPDIVHQWMLRYPRLHLIQNNGNRGKGYSVRNGMLHATGDVMLFTDADLSSPIYEADKLFAAIKQGADVAIGSRWLQRELQTERQPWYRQLYGRLFNFALRVVLGLKYHDTQCGFKAFTRRAVETIFTRQRVERWGFDPELLFLADKFEFRTAEVPVEWAHDHRSKINPLRDGMKMMLEMLAVRWNDIKGLYKLPTAVPEQALAESAASLPIAK